MPNARLIAIDVLNRVFYGGAYSHIALDAALSRADLSSRDAGLVTELVYGTLARKRTIDALLEEFVNRPLKKLDRPVLLSLRMAVYQLLFLDRIPAHAAVDEAVEISKSRCGRGAAGFTNGVLRSLLRSEDRWQIWSDVDPNEQPLRYLGLRHSLPDWIAARLIERHGFEDAMKMAATFNERAPLYLRRANHTTQATFEGLQPVDSVPGAFRADSMTDEISAGLSKGELVVQDLGSQLIGHYCAPKKGQRILDACAGLGGKSLHLAALVEGQADLMAVEPQGSKLDKLKQSIEAAGLDGVETFQGELEQLPEDVGDFDLILVDAPCTGLGVMRRHPETRWRRSESDVNDRAALQETLMEQACARVRPGGVLIYSVCTFTAEEGPGRVENFLRDHPPFRRTGPPDNSGVDWTNLVDPNGDLQLNPLEHDTDAFYACRLRYSPTNG